MGTRAPGAVHARAERLRERVAVGGSTDSGMLALGAATGLVTGGLAAVLIAGIRWVQQVTYGTEASTLEVLLWPAAGGVVVGLVLRYWAIEPSGSGVVRTMETLALHGGRARRRVPGSTLVAASVALGTGASGGREGPIVLVGGSVGSILGQWVRVDETRLRALVATGAAAGIAASFNAPIGGMLFAIEIILGRLRATSLQVVVVGAVVASVTARTLVGPGIIFEPSRTYGLGDARQLLLYAGLGLVAMLAALLLGHAEEAAATTAAWLRRRVPIPVVVGLSGLVVGAIALVVPQVLGTGDQLPPIDGVRDPILAMLDGDVGAGWGAVGLLVALALAKLLATAVTVGFGNAAGTFAPAVFIGAAIGSAWGTVGATLFPGMGIEPGAFALAGTAAVFAAAARAPMTAVLIAFELTGDYELVLPMMLAAGLATFLADRISQDSLYEAPLRLRGIVFSPPADDVDVMQVLDASEAMSTDHPTVAPELPLDDLRDLFRSTGSHGFAVVDGQRLVGVVTLSDVDAAADRSTATTAGSVSRRHPATVHPDAPLHVALQRMAALGVGRIPVVTGRDHYLGIIRRSDVVAAYQQALTRKVSDQHRTQTSHLRDLTGVRALELSVGDGSLVTDRDLRDVPWPPRTLVASIRRGSEVVVPDGATRLQPGDDLTVLADPDEVEQVRALLVRGGTALGDTSPDLDD